MGGWVGGGLGRVSGETDEHTALFWEGAFHLRVPCTASSPSGRWQGHGSGAKSPFQKKPSTLSLSLSPSGAALGVSLVDFKFQVPAVTASGRQGMGWGGCWGGVAIVARAQPVTFSVDTQAPMVEPELTEVGELHSLTDWQVSEASEEAELDEFCRREGPHATKSNRKSRQKTG